MLKDLLKCAGERSPLVYNFRSFSTNNFLRRVAKALVTPFCIHKYFFAKEVPEREGLAFVLIAKNEAPYIEEWINFHVKQGVSHFIIYDNDSTDNFYDVLKPYIKSGLVTYSRIKGRARQFDAYNMATVKYGRKFKYMGFIDTDEFVFVRKLPDGGGGLQSI